MAGRTGDVETEHLGWIFGFERCRFALLFLAAELSSGTVEGWGMVRHRHMAEGYLLGPKVRGGQSNLLASC